MINYTSKSSPALVGLGKYTKLVVNRESAPGLYLQNGDEEILLPNKYTAGLKPGDTVEVFIYKDSEDRPVATTEKPLAILGEYAVMEMVGEAPFGVFMEMGLEKHLLVPKAEMIQDMEVGKKYLIRVMLDYKTERLIGVSKIESYAELPEDLEENIEVHGIVYQKTDLGYKVWVNNSFIGLIYHNQVFDSFSVGDEVTCYIDKIRHDDKVDLRLRKGGVETIDSDAEQILNHIRNNGGEINITDKSSPEAIKEAFGLSKKAFKRAVGTLYKQKQIELLSDSIKLCAE